MHAANSVSTITYQASWHLALDPNQHGFLWQLASKVKNFIFYFPLSLVAACINPRRESFPDGATLIQTPDRVTLGVRIDLPGRNYRIANPKYVLFCNPLGQNTPRQDWEEDFSVTLNQKGFSVVRFNYRGLGSTWSPKDLVIDGESVYQYLVNYRQISPQNIHFYGQSLGGAVAAAVKALHPEADGKYVGDRTFRSIFHVVAELFVVSRFGKLVQRISSVVSHLITGCIAYPLYWLGLDLNAEDALCTMRGERRVFYLSQDVITHGSSGLHHVCPSEEIIHIIDGNHFSPISHQFVQMLGKDKQQMTVSASHLAADFLAADVLLSS